MWDDTGNWDCRYDDNIQPVIRKDIMDRGKVYVVGIGPGNYEGMTRRAIATLNLCGIIVGYTLYCEQMKPFFPDKEYISTPMMGEEKRVQIAFEKAEEGFTVGIICSGDAGVYGMASLAYRMTKEYQGIEVEVIPGITAALSGAALLGAPLIHDFCVISMSDRLTPMELIEKRLRAAAEADFVIVIYNPESRSRKGYLSHACRILLESIEPERICGIARQIGRDGESREVMTLSELSQTEADMFTTVFIGNSSTVRIEDYMVTLRGYRSEG